MDINPNIFREYDIRGIVGQDLSPEVVRILGRGTGTYFRRRGQRTVAVGRDCRLSSPEYYRALADGLKSVGCRPVDVLSVSPCGTRHGSIRIHSSQKNNA